MGICFKIADGGKKAWIGDGFCDDMNNREFCEFDGGDCCGAFTKIHFCIECRCISKFILRCFTLIFQIIGTLSSALAQY